MGGNRRGPKTNGVAPGLEAHPLRKAGEDMAKAGEAAEDVRRPRAPHRDDQVTTEERDLREPLMPGECEAMGIRLADAHVELERIKERKKELEKKRDALSADIQEHATTRTRIVQVIKNPHTKEYIEITPHDGRILESRILKPQELASAEERTLKLPFDKAPADIPEADAPEVEGSYQRSPEEIDADERDRLEDPQ